MPRSSTTVHETEWDILTALWEHEPATARDVTEALIKHRAAL